jgi:hypothetical protein
MNTKKVALVVAAVLAVAVPMAGVLMCGIGWMASFIMDEYAALDIFMLPNVLRWVAAAIYLTVVAAGYYQLGAWNVEEGDDEEASHE